MTTLAALLLQISLPLLVGLAASGYLSRATRRLLLDLCGTEDRADFWVRATAILLTGTPLALVLLFGQAGGPVPALPEIARQALTLSLLGLLLGVAVLARLIWKRVPLPAGEA